MLQSLAAIFLRLGSKLAVASPETQKPIAMDGLRGTLVPIPGIGPGTSPLPRECSATEPNGQYGAGKEARTLDLNLGKVALYQLSYSRVVTA